jgi:hypothetical protein
VLHRGRSISRDSPSRRDSSHDSTSPLAERLADRIADRSASKADRTAGKARLHQDAYMIPPSKHAFSAHHAAAVAAFAPLAPPSPLAPLPPPPPPAQAGYWNEATLDAPVVAAARAAVAVAAVSVLARKEAKLPRSPSVGSTDRISSEWSAAVECPNGAQLQNVDGAISCAPRC